MEQTFGLPAYDEPLVQNIQLGLEKNGILQDDNDITFTSSQRSAILLLKQWFRSQSESIAAKRYFILAGAAGTGKSSLIQYIVSNLGLLPNQVLCAAFTGKAAFNMIRKGNEESHTLHHALYDVQQPSHPWEMPTFIRKSHLFYRLIIVDEASMISRDLFDDVLSFGIPVIFIGDHCQLPPVDDDFNLMEHPDFTLTEIMRQAKESPIIRASQLAIQGKPIPFCAFQNFRKIHEEDLKEEDFLWADQIVVGTNKTRHALNTVSREVRKFIGEPQEGERFIILQNNPKFRVFNGQIWISATKPRFYPSSACWEAEFLDEVAEQDPISRLSRASLKDLRFVVRNPGATWDTTKVYMDYGYAISCHKAQGSGWNRVLVYDERFGSDEDTRRRWLYTAITRAKQEILIVSH